EELDDFGLNVNHATFRVLDPELGRWWSVDPDATMFGGLSPYNSMFNSPIVHSDPNGDNPLLIGAGIGFLMNGLNNVSNGQNFFQGGFEAAVVSGLQAGIASGIGSAFGNTGSFVKEAGRAAAHGLAGGAFSAAQGNGFGSGFASGAVSSGIGSGIDALGGGAGAQIIGGGLSGGVSSVISGGNFYEGFGTGLSVSILNHATQNVWSKLNVSKATDQEIIDRLIQAWQESKECFDCSSAYSPLDLDEYFRNFPIPTVADATHKPILGNGYINGNIIPLDIEFPIHKHYRLIDWGGGHRTRNFVKSSGIQYDSFIVSSAKASQGLRYAGGITFTTPSKYSTPLYNFLFR
ncbi:MAG: hypothetical protein AAF960_29925, partial [Bacteroidota bacterium]